MFGLSSTQGDRFDLRLIEASPFEAQVQVHIAPVVRKRRIPLISLAVRAHRHVRLHPVRSMYCRCSPLRHDGRRADIRVHRVNAHPSIRVSVWDQGEMGWSGVRLETLGGMGTESPVTIDFAPRERERLGPFLELRFEAAVDRVSVGEARCLYEVGAQELVPVACR